MHPTQPRRGHSHLPWRQPSPARRQAVAAAAAVVAAAVAMVDTITGLAAPHRLLLTATSDCFRRDCPSPRQCLPRVGALPPPTLAVAAVPFLLVSIIGVRKHCHGLKAASMTCG